MFVAVDRAADAAGALVHLAECESFGGIAAAAAALLHEREGVRGHGGEGNQVEAIVLHHRLERTRVPAAKELEISRGNLHLWHIADARDAAQHAFERAEPAAAFISRLR